jgi:hypothetical protein
MCTLMQKLHDEFLGKELTSIINMLIRRCNKTPEIGKRCLG